MENVNNSEYSLIKDKQKLPFCFQVWFIVLTALIGGYISAVIFIFGRRKFAANEDYKMYKTLGLILFAIGVIGNIYLLNQYGLFNS